ncbi:unnamed protein product [Rotaria magnacalcarata]|uniref:Reverse transcriptase domain-containing protein n=1 Tax=Rotaria magnacalcarata TaxID=392030 RepID=A0A816NK69_9BILA|nr:unnamed protein product [Rotaria magnacalcarata]CAF3802740.1 unnamed protein product [Rotaria magnacalcarata]
MQEFVHIHQEENQSVTSFYERVIRKYRKDRQCITEQQVITVLQTGVKNSFKEYLIRNEKDITKPDEWLQYARQEEYIQKRIQQQRNNFYSETTNQPFFEPMLQTATIQSRLLNAKSLGQQPTTPHHYYQKQHQHASKFNNNRTNEKQIQHPTIKSSRPSYLETKMHRSDSCLICNRKNHSTMNEALIDTGSAITIIHENLLNIIPYKTLIRKTIQHLSANCSTLNIIGELQLEININGLKTKVTDDVATNLVTNLILGNDWIQPNNVYILTPEKRIMIRRQALFLANALCNIEDRRIKINIINATNRQQTLSRGTKLGIATQISTTIGVTISSDNLKERIPNGKACMEPIPKGKGAITLNEVNTENNSSIALHKKQHECRACHQNFETNNDLFKHLRSKCYPEEIRHQINKSIEHISDEKQREQILKILWKYGKLFDISEPSKIEITLKNAIDNGIHRPIHTPPYRKSNKDQETLNKETDKLLKNGIIEHSTSQWSSPVVLVQKKDGTTRFCVDYRRLNQITTKDAFPLPRIDDIYDQLTKATHFTKFDFKSGYFQVPLDKADRPKTAFSTRDGHFQFKVLPQGLTNGPPTFQRIVNQILGPNR